jgi:hypothetical protein
VSAGQCRSCRAPVTWAETEAGRRIPVDAEPSQRGNLVLRERTGLPPLAVVVVGAVADGEGPLHLSHFVTCPQASQWRGRPR